MGLLDALQDKGFRNDVADGLRNALNRGLLGGVLGAPIDLATMAMRPLGYKVDKPVMGSDWIGQKMQDAGMVSSKRNQLAEMMAGLLDPATMATGAIKVASATPIMAGMFIGKNAKTWDALQASKAMELEKAGTPARQIWSETGTWKGPDGMWRQEIPDSKAKMKIEKNSSIYSSLNPNDTIKDLLSHSSLFKSYPSLSTVKVEQYPGLGASYGSGYTPETKAILEKVGIDVPSVLMENMSFGVNSGKTDVIHEMQHAIQGREGFALGGNAKGMAAPENRVDGINSEEAYRRLAGEAEARATQTRIPLDASQRRAIFPEDSYDVPINQLILRGLLER